MKNLRQALVTAALLAISITAISGEEPKAAANAPPKTLSVKEALALISKAELTGQGCGAATWNGEQWSYFVNGYKPIKLPWESEPQRVMAGFAYGLRMESHLIDFSGPGFRYKRLTDVPDLTLQPPAEAK